jgi:3-hydroxymyristoyl/3-hydroxydecanoyl-(acyl carrier protein) dehydratase
MFELIHSISLDVEGGKATGHAMVPKDYPVLADHFPERQLLPGSFLIELASQIAGPLAEELVKARFQQIKSALLGMVRESKFLYVCALPTTLRIHVEAMRLERSSVNVKAGIDVNGSKVFQGELVMMMQEIRPEWREAFKMRKERLEKWKAAAA